MGDLIIIPEETDDGEAVYRCRVADTRKLFETGSGPSIVLTYHKELLRRLGYVVPDDGICGDFNASIEYLVDPDEATLTIITELDLPDHIDDVEDALLNASPPSP